VAVLIDTNILIYRYDERSRSKQRKAEEILRRGASDQQVRIPHQAIIEFVAAAPRAIGGFAVLSPQAALREAEEMLKTFPILYPNEAILRLAMRGCLAYQLNWFDAHLWAYAEYYGLAELITEDLQHGRLYGSVRIVNPFLTRPART